jgi:TonB family protein
MSRISGRTISRSVLFGSFLVLAGGSLANAQETSRRIIKKVEAQYPAILKRRGIGGIVRMKVTVKPDGTVKHIEILGGNAILADSAQSAVNQWKFAESAGESVVEVAVSFDPHS